MRVAVTGVGLVTPLGVGTARTWGRLLAGESGIRSTRELGPAFEGLASKVAAWVTEAEVAQLLETVSSMRRGRKWLDRPEGLSPSLDRIEDRASCQNISSMRWWRLLRRWPMLGGKTLALD